MMQYQDHPLPNFLFKIMKLYCQYLLLVTLLTLSCSKKDIPGIPDIKSDYLNSLLSSAEIDVINIDHLVSDTLFFDENSTLCVNGELEDYGLRSIGDIHIFNDSLIIVADITSGTVWAINNSINVTTIASKGNGPGEIQTPLIINSIADTLFISDHKFVHAFDKNMKYMYRFAKRELTTLPLSTLLISPTLYLGIASINEPDARFYKYMRSKDSLKLIGPLFDLIVDPQKAQKSKIGFNSVYSAMNNTNNTILFHYYSSPNIFLSDDTGKILRIVRLESSGLLDVEPTYVDSDFEVAQNSGSGNLIPGENKLKHGNGFSQLRLLDNMDIQFIYEDRYLITLASNNGSYSLSSSIMFSNLSNSDSRIYIHKLVKKNDGRYVGFSMTRQCILYSL